MSSPTTEESSAHQKSTSASGSVDRPVGRGTPITDAACKAWNASQIDAGFREVVPAWLSREMELLIDDLEDFTRSFVYIPGSKTDRKANSLLTRCYALRSCDFKQPNAQDLLPRP